MSFADPAAVAETHSATVFFVGDHAYKLKKPVDLGFLDFRTREAREAICHREVELNRRLAPDVYEGVADVLGPDGELCDHLIVMRRMPADRRLSSLVLAGEPVEPELDRVARVLAMLHGTSPRSEAADRAAGSEATRRRWSDNTDQIIAMEGRLLDDATVGLVHGLACRYLDGRTPLLEHRVAIGRAVDGHGDLLADDIFCLPDGPRILDCIEFADDLRLGDGLADAAFLAMDLERLGRPDLGAGFLAAYAEHRGDVWPASLAHHQIAYRAQVRAKVTALRAQQGDPAAPAKAVALLQLAADHLERGRIRLVLVGGLPGTGKSTLAEGLGRTLGAVVLRTDEVRKELAGIPQDRHDDAGWGEGIYTSEMTGATYDLLLERAEAALGMGETVVLDASWMHPGQRERAHALATGTHSDLVQLRCEAPADLAARRLGERAEAGRDPSDATPAIAREMARIAPEWPDARTIDTTGAPEESLAAALQDAHLGG